jgi:integration host factor subunit beta
MTKSELIENLVLKNPNLTARQVENGVAEILEQIMQSLVNDSRLEVRGFGSFSLHYRQPRIGRNPKTGEKVTLTAKCVPHFKMGKDLKDRLNPA